MEELSSNSSFLFHQHEEEEDRESSSSVEGQIITSSPRSYRPKRPRFSSQGQFKSEAPDRISALPDSIVHRILSFLPIEDAVRTCVLSKKWKLSWTFVPNIAFCNRRGSDRVPDFVAFVDKTLILFSSCKVKRFLIQFEYQNRYASHVDTWVQFAIRHCVEKLYLNFRLKKKLRDLIMGSHHYLLPQSFCTNSSIKVLALRFCKFAPEANICWTNLKVLRIGSANLSNDVIQNILLGSPLLKELRLHKFMCIENLDINSTSLKELELEGERDIWPISIIITISAPNLQSLSILGFMSWRKFRLTNVSSLVEADIRFNMTKTLDDYINNSYENHRNQLAELLERLGHVNKLSIGTWCLQVLSILEVKTLPSPLSKRKCLVLNTQLNKWDLPGIASLLQSSSNLEKLVINVTPWHNSQSLQYEFDRDFTNTNNFDDKNYWRSQKSIYKCLLLHLKIVEIVGFEEECSGLTFIIGLLEFLVMNARVLEKMVIYGIGGTYKHPRSRILIEASGLHEMTQILMLLQRSCPNAVVMSYFSSNLHH